MGVGVGICVAVGTGVAVYSGVNVTVGVAVFSGVEVMVGVAECRGVSVAVAVDVNCLVGVETWTMFTPEFESIPPCREHPAKANKTASSMIDLQI